MPLVLPNLDYIFSDDKRYGEAFRSLRDAVNAIAKQTGTDATNNLDAPPNIQSFVVNAANGTFTGTITDNSDITRAINYFVEWSTDVNFSNPPPRTMHLGAARDFDGVSLGNVTAFFRAYSAYQGSKASAAVYATTNPVVGGGAAAPTYPTPGGAGTAISNGQQSGTGFGPSLAREKISKL